MSKKIDEQVVSMQFDNRHFEQNVSHTMSTLDKLKAKLSFGKTPKSMESLTATSKNVKSSFQDMEATACKSGFHISDVWQKMSSEFENRIASRIVSSAKKIVSALTIDPVKTGYSEYVTQLNATQTILSNVAHKGKTIEDVNRALDELNEYADKTIYNFTEMTKNIGLFVNAGVDLDTSVSAIKGFSNAAAMSGADATTTARAMYQLSQAMSSGSVKLMDWKSLETANITGERFRETIKMTAQVHGINVDAMEKKEGSFRETLKSGWLSAELMSEALDHYTLSLEGMTEAEITARKEQMKAKGYTDEQIQKLFELGTEATNAATKVKSFSQMFDVLKEAAQSGWAKTWRIIFGDLEQAKAVFTPLTNFFQKFIDGISDFRNRMLEAFLGSPIGKLSEKISKLTSVSSTAAGKMKDLGDIVDRVIRGEFGNVEPRWQKLTELGYDWAHVQNLVNEKLGNGYRRATNYAEGQEELTQATMELTDAQLKELGFTDSEIKAYRELEKESKKTGKSIQELAKEMDGMTGRDRIIKSLAKIGKAWKDAWSEIFPPRTESQMNKMAEALANFSKKLLMSDETADRLRRTFRGLFAAIDIVLTVIGGPIKIALKVLFQLLGMFDVPVLSLTANLGDMIVKLRDFIDGIFDCTKIAEKIIPVLKRIIKAVRDWIVGMKDAENIPKYIISGLINGLRSGASGVMSAITYIAEIVINTFKKLFGIHSPSVVFMALGGFLIAGLVAGLTNTSGDAFGAVKTIGSNLFEIVKTIFSKIIEFIKGLDFAKLFAVTVVAGIFLTVRKLLGILGAFGRAADAFGGLMESTAGVMDALRDRIKPNKFKQTAETIRTLAIAIAILAGSMWLLSKVESGDLIKAGIALGALMAMLVGLVAIIKKIDLQSVDMGKLTKLLLSLSITIYMTATAIKKMSFLNKDNIGPILVGVAAMFTGLIGVLWAMGKFVKGDKHETIEQTAKLIRKIATTMLLMALAIKLINKLDDSAITKGIRVMSIFAGFIVGLMAATRLAGRGIDTAGASIKKIAVAMLLMVATIKVISWMDQSEIQKGIGVLAMFELLIVGLMASTKLMAGKRQSLANFGKMMIGIGTAMMLMAIATKICGSMSREDMATGLACITMFGALAVALTAAVSKVKGQVKGVASTIMAMSVAVMLMGTTAVILSLVDPAGLARGVLAVSAFGLVVSTMVKSLNGAKDVHKTVKAMTMTIAVLAGSLILLSMIDPARLAAATVAMTSMMLVVTLFMRSMKTLSTGEKTYKRQIASIFAISMVVGLLGTVMAIMASKIENPMALVPIAIGMGILLLAMSESLAIMDKVGSKDKTKPMDIAKKLGVMVLIIGGIAAVLAVLSLIANPEPLIPLATAITIVMTALTGTVAALAGLSKVVDGAGLKQLITPLTVVGLLISIIAGVLGLVSNVTNPEPLIPLANSIAIVMTTLTGVVAAVVLLSKICPPGVLGAAQPILLLMVEIIVGFGVLAVALGGLMKVFPSLIQFINTGVQVLVAVAEGIGEVIGAFIGGVAAGIATVLPKIGKSLSKFATNAQPFFDSLKSLNASTLAAVGILVGAIMALTAASLIDGILSFCTFGQGGLSGFGKRLNELGRGIYNFSETVKMVDGDNVKAGAKAISDIAKATHKIPTSGGILGMIMGGKNLSKFAFNLPLLGRGIADFSWYVSGNGFNASNVKAGATAIADVAKSTSKIPTSGGLLGMVMGGKNIGSFARNLPLLGLGIANFAYHVSGNGFNASNVKTGATAVADVAKSTSKIPTSGGMLSWIIGGDRNIFSFANNLPLLGKGLASFSKSVSSDSFKADNVKEASKAAESIAKMTKYVPKTSGLEVWFGSGADSVSRFAKNLGPLGKGLKDFSTNLGTDLDGDAIANAAKAGSAIAELTKSAPNKEGVKQWFEGTSSISEYSDVFPSLGKGLKEFANNISGIKTTDIDGGAKAAKAFCDIVSIKPPQGGLSAWLGVDLGDEEEVKQATSMFTTMGNIVNAFATGIEGMPEEKLSTIETAANAFTGIISGFSDMSQRLSEIYYKSGNVVMSTTMVKTVTDDIENIINSELFKKMGAAIKAFVDAAPGADELKGHSAEAIGTFVQGIQTVVDTATKLKDIKTDDVIGGADTTHNKLALLGSSISSFYNLYMKAVSQSDIDFANTIIASLSDLDAKMSEIKSDKEGTTELLTVIQNLVANTEDAKVDRAKKGSENFKSLCDNLVTAFGVIKTIDDDDSEIYDKADRIVAFIRQLDTSVNTENAEQVSGAISTLVTAVKDASGITDTSADNLIACINKIGDNLDLTSAKIKFTDAGKELVEAFKTGLSDTTKVEAVNTTAVSIATGSANAISAAEHAKGEPWYDAGVYCVQGLITGLKDTKPLAELAAEIVASDMLTAAKKEFNEKSPSKKFAEIGKFGVLGLVKGFEDTASKANDASVDLADGVLKAFQDRLEIHSPSLVMTEQGRYIVKGIADGITKEMSAEEAAEKKAQNIIDAFASVFDPLDSKIERINAEADLAIANLGPYADPDEIAAIDKNRNDQILEVLKNKDKYAENEYDVALEQFKNGEIMQKQLDDVAAKFARTKEETAKHINEAYSSDIENITRPADEKIAEHEWLKEQDQVNREDFLARKGKLMTDDEISKYMRDELTKDLEHDKAIADIESKEYNDILRFYINKYEDWDAFPTEVKTIVRNAWKNAKEADQTVRETEDKINDYLLGDEQRDVEAIEKRAEKDQHAYEHFIELYGDTLSPDELDNLEISNERGKITRLNNQIKENKELLALYAERYGVFSDEYEKLEEAIKADYEAIELSNKRIEDIIKSGEERRLEESKEKNSIAAERVDAEYSLWEATLGRDASSAEKNTAKLASLSKKVTIQTSSMHLAYKEWQDAAAEYGEASNEAQSKYNEYLNTQLELANLQNEILDIEETTIKRQKLAKSDYNDYMKTYAKYYELNGLSYKQLEQDARLVSGYDPNATVNSIFDSTKNALDNVTQSSKYTELMEGFSNVGTSYVGAVKDGVSSSAAIVEDSIITMLETCLTGVKSDNIKAKWIEAGKFIVAGFVEGVKNNIELAAQAAAKMAHEALEAAKAEFDEHSPSRKFEEIGKYAVLGLVKGFDNNAHLSNSAAENLADKAIENLRATISRIYDTVDSEINTQPTIRPVLDLSGVESKASQLNAMLSRDLAMGISANMDARRDSAKQNGAGNGDTTNNYNFTQNNYSPKALSRPEIYRQTKNQFAALKGALG